MAIRAYSNIYGGNWSYSFYGGQQGIAITEKNTNTHIVETKPLEMQQDGVITRSVHNNIQRDNKKKTNADNDNVQLKAPELGSREEQVTNELIEAKQEFSRFCPDSPRPGTGYTLVGHVQLKRTSTRNQGFNKGETVKDALKQRSCYIQNDLQCDSNDSEKEKVNKHEGEKRTNDSAERPKQDIEAFRRRLREKVQTKEKEHAEQREVLWKWVLEKSQKEGYSRSKSTGDLLRSSKLSTLEDIVEDDRVYIEDGSGKRSSTDSNYGFDEPPPLPPRQNRGSVTSLGSDVRRKHAANRRKNRSSLPLGLSSSDVDNQMVSPRSPAVRKRDAMQRRYNSTSALFGSAVSPVDDADFDAPARDVLILRRTSSRPDESSTDDVVRNGSSGGSGSWPTSPAEVFGDPSNYFSAQHYDGDVEDHLDKVDIVGESFEARYPWQRDVSTQCNISHLYRTSTSSSRTSCTSFASSYASEDSIDTPTPSVVSSNSPEIVLRKKTNAFRQKRPHSIGCMDNMIYEAEMEKIRELNSRRVRHSEPFIQNTSGLYRKRLPLLPQDDPEIVSDLESILENPREGTVDSSRNNSIISEDGVSADELSSLLKNPQNGRSYLDVLPSPRVSPEMWSNVPDVVVNTEDERISEREIRYSSSGSQYLEVPCKLPRRKSSGSVTSGSEDSDVEPSPPVVRRGRRSAIVDTKNFGDVSPTTLSPEVSPSNSCDEGEGASNIAGRLRRRRSSVDLAMSIYPGDLLVQEHHKKLIKRNTISDFYAGRNGSTPSLNDDNKKARQPFSLLKLMKTRSKESLSHLGDILQKLKPSEFKDNHLAAYKSVHWTDLIASTDKQTSVADSLNISEMERKRRETVWELFKSECVFLIDHLMVLKHCFLEPLKKVQVEGFLMYAEPLDIFSNLDELCYVSYTFCKDFIAGLVKDMSATDFGRTSILIKAFQRFSTHSKDGEVYHSYCLNYTNALNYLETLRKNDDFCEFEKWCEQDARCNRLQLADLLISPMQHCTKLPLLLYNIKKYTENPTEKQQIADSIQKVETSLQQLEDKMKWLKNFERVQEIQRHLVWPSVTDLDPRAFIPEYLKSKLLQQPCERLLACPRRQLIHEGAISLTESAKTHDAYLFLFDDILLITKIKKPNRKKQTVSDVNHSKQNSSSQPDRQTYIVHRQPIALDRFGIHDVSSSEAAANGLKYAFVLVQISRFQQIIDVFTLQAPTELVKSSWMVQIREAKRKYNSVTISRDNSLKEEEDIIDNNNREPYSKEQPQMDSVQVPSSTVRRRSGPNVKKIQHGKSLSVDAIFL